MKNEAKVKNSEKVLKEVKEMIKSMVGREMTLFLEMIKQRLFSGMIRFLEGQV